MSSSYSKDWELHELSDVCYFQEGPGLRNWQYRETGIKFMNIRCIKEGAIDTSIAQCLAADEVHAKYKHFLLDEDDIVLSSSGTIGRAAVVKKEDLPLLLNTSVIRFRPINYSLLDREYLFYFLQSEQFLDEILEQSQGSAQVNFGPTHLKQLQILLPPLPEQKKIAEILSGIDENIRCHLQRLHALGNIQSSLYCEIPSRAEAGDGAILGDIVSSINSGWSPVCPPQSRVGEDLAILKTTAITWQGYAPEENKVLPSEHNSKDDAIVRPGDILCTRKGPRERVGVVCYVSDTPPNLMVPDTAFRIRLSENMNSHYVSLVLGSKEVQEDWNRKKVGLAEAQVNINHGILKETYIPLPSRERQAVLVNAITCSRERMNREEAKITALQILRSSLVSDLLSGRKRVSV